MQWGDWAALGLCCRCVPGTDGKRGTKGGGVPMGELDLRVAPNGRNTCYVFHTAGEGRGFLLRCKRALFLYSVSIGPGGWIVPRGVTRRSIHMEHTDILS